MIRTTHRTIVVALGCSIGMSGMHAVCRTPAPEGARFYVDAQTGNDANDGRSAASAWRSFAPVHRLEFRAGDRLLLRSGCVFQGPLVLRGRGRPGNPIVVSRYGAGPFPRIEGSKGSDAVVSILDGEYWEISEIEITNTLPDGRRRNNLRGLSIQAAAGGTFHHFVLRRLHIHHVSGGWDRHGGHGIFLRAWGDDPKRNRRASRFDGVLIEDCWIHDVSFYGIMLSGWENRFRDERWFPSLNVRIRNNLIHDTGGDGIVVLACLAPVLEHNEAHRCCLGQEHGGHTAAAGIWPHSCDGAVIRWNRVVDNRGVHDGEAFDVDNNCRDAIVEYNWSERNPGGFLLVCSGPGEASPTHNVRVRNNLSLNDGIHRWGRVFCPAGKVHDIVFRHNAIIHTAEATVTFMGPFDYGRGLWARAISFQENLFAAAGTFRYKTGGLKDVTFNGNLYAGRFESWPADSAPRRLDPERIEVVGGVVRIRSGDGRVQEFLDVRGAGLLPESSWTDRRDASLERSRRRPLGP